MPTIRTVFAMEILDLSCNPTVRVFCSLDNGVRASASVPSGASTCENGAVELRDDDLKRCDGKGVLATVKNTAMFPLGLIGIWGPFGFSPVAG